ncbi:helix-turn-helix transcriptional regulator [Halobacillus sp. A5]|uniref:helix-turn-helix domain-containing protein n=1 Tax=Halobacillus sp. A5 TaxID=2880263 RepID=UPI0020A66CBA|nr:helix-turn-helix transcriptional regulator [Halobacillus sp. A5]MCP3026019.1 helix-turn-helix transcriptional regulator [Halobacillus sp. A5]
MELTERELTQIKRRRAGISLEVAAKELGCHYTYLSKWERDKRDMPDKLVSAYQQYVNERQ